MIKLPEIITENELFIFLLHIIHERFRDNAILKGGMVLRLLGSKRKTLDLDYTFIPFASKKEVLASIESLFSEIEGLSYNISTNSKAIRVNIEVGKLRSQVEVNVAKELKTDVMSTAHLKSEGSSVTPRIIKIMSLDVALANKFAAWNERRLLRDLYDIYYYLGVQGVEPDLLTLENRLSNIQSRRPEMRKVKNMEFSGFIAALKKTVDQLQQNDLERELGGILDSVELAGLALRIKDIIGTFIIRSNSL